ncbi:hypothetical protein Tco_0275587, partial [Tanacetum coccineum]
MPPWRLNRNAIELLISDRVAATIVEHKANWPMRLEPELEVPGQLEPEVPDQLEPKELGQLEAMLEEMLHLKFADVLTKPFRTAI